MFTRPNAERFYRLPKGATEVGQFVVDTRRDGRKNRAASPDHRGRAETKVRSHYSPTYA